MQQRGPPTVPITSSDFAVMRWDKAKGSPERGVESEMMETNMPVLMPAPQAPQNPRAARNALPAIFHLCQRSGQINVTARILICCQQRRTDHNVMLRTVHVTERKCHHFVEDLHGIFGGFRKAHTEDTDLARLRNVPS